MDKENVLRWFCSDVDFRVTKVLKQHWYKSKYSYLNHPRPDFGLLLLVSGSVSFETEHGAVSVCAGNLVFLPKHSRYEAVFSNEADDYLICFDADDDRFLSCTPMILFEAVDLACYEKFRILSDENRYTVRTQLYNKGSFLLLLNSIAELTENGGDEHSNIVKRACELLQKNEKITIEQIAKKCAVSTSLLRQSFLEKLGISPIQYRTEMKMRQAAYLIESTNMTVSEIAEYLSFFDAAYFCKVFRSHTGMTPTQYAKSKRI
ncbi:MAG: helix-turn-helix transcriptional regulator [Clostridia bacterium]|nr:helix-turn-helix transcriptional regulator [Clostridia bacterium]